MQQPVSLLAEDYTGQGPSTLSALSSSISQVLTERNGMGSTMFSRCMVLVYETP